MTVPGIDGVPLFMGQEEADHSSELLRTLIWAIFRGQEGFLTRGAGYVTTLDTPGPGVALYPGPFVICSRFPGMPQQSYMARIVSATELATGTVPAGFPGGVRYDLVVCNIEDPVPSNGVVWPTPSTSEGRRLGPYWRPRIIENVPSYCVAMEQIPSNHPSGARSWTALPCARIRRPANTSTITDDMITRINPILNLASQGAVQIPPEIIANLEDFVSDVQETVGGIVSGRVPIPGQYAKRVGCVAPNSVLLPTQTNYTDWPRDGIFSDVVIPTWATHAEIFAFISNVWQGATAANLRAHVYGASRIRITANGTTIYGDDNGFDQDELNDGDNRPPPPNNSTQYDQSGKTYRPGNRLHVVPSSSIYIPSNMRGKRAVVATQAKGYADKGTQGKLVADIGSAVYLEIKFKEKP